MTRFTPPLHIDFMPHQRRFKNERQYWFMTWIFGPDNVQIWCKLYNGWWRLETPTAYNMFPVPNATETIGKHKLVRSGDLKGFMDATLAEYMRENNFTEPYHFYWLNNKQQSQTVVNFHRP